MKGVFFKRVIKPHEPCHPQTFLTPPPQPPSEVFRAVMVTDNEQHAVADPGFSRGSSDLGTGGPIDFCRKLLENSRN